MRYFFGVLVSVAILAAQQSPRGGYNPIAAFLPLLIIFAIFYFLLILPQSRAEKRRKKMLESLRKGDRVVTTGGIYGTIQRIEGDVLTLRIAPEINIKIDRSAVARVLKEPSEKAEKK